jgi:hypothetical protein
MNAKELLDHICRCAATRLSRGLELKADRERSRMRLEEDVAWLSMILSEGFGPELDTGTWPEQISTKIWFYINHDAKQRIERLKAMIAELERFGE